jgi:hypothetical protein
VPEQEAIDMGKYDSIADDCMSWVRKRYSHARFGILLIMIGLLWFAQRAGWFPSGIFAPLVLLTFGVWMIVTAYLRRLQAPPSLLASLFSCCGSQFRPDGHEATRQDHATADKMLCPERLAKQKDLLRLYW